MDEQAEFLFADGPQPEMHLAHPLADFLQTVAATWSLPIGGKVRLSLNGGALEDLQGTLELVRAPNLPLDRREPLRLRVCGVTFSSVEITAWSLLE